jgi:glycosyltransferase involved in cell wall biosynthesis
LPLVVRINANFDLLHAEAQMACYPRLYRWRSVERAVGRFVLSRADLIAPGSEDNLRYALANGAGPERTTIWRYGMWIDPLHFSVEPEDRPSVREELALGERPFFLLVSRLAAIKHPEDAVRVLAAAKQREPRMAAVLVGGGLMQAEIEDLARELGVHDDLHILGYRDQPWLASALSSADVVISTLTGRALVEACLSGTPVVAYDVEWQSELIRPDETGILVPYRDADAMAEAVCKLVREPELGSRLGRRARAFAAGIMDPQTLLLRETADYERLLGSSALHS